MSPSGFEIGVAHRIAVDRGIIERRQIDRRDHVGARARGRRASRERTVSLSATGATRSAISRSISSSRQQRPGKREAVVGELRHQRAPRGQRASSGAACASRMIGDRLDVVEVDHRHGRAGSGASEAIGDDVRIVGMQQRLADGGAMDFELGMRLALVALDQHQIDRRQLGQQLAQRRLRLAAQFMHQRPARRRADQHFGRAGHAVAMGILARLVEVEAVMRVLERSRPQARARSSRGISLVSSVVLPEPLQPARPMMRMAPYSKNACCPVYPRSALAVAQVG